MIQKEILVVDELTPAAYIMFAEWETNGKLIHLEVDDQDEELKKARAHRSWYNQSGTFRFEAWMNYAYGEMRKSFLRKARALGIPSEAFDFGDEEYLTRPQSPKTAEEDVVHVLDL